MNALRLPGRYYDLLPVGNQRGHRSEFWAVLRRTHGLTDDER